MNKSPFKLLIGFFLTIYLLSSSVLAGNWNQSSKRIPLQVKNPIQALNGFGLNSMALWSGGSRTDPENKSRFLSHFEPLQKYGVKHVVLVSCADWIIGINCKKHFQNLKGIIQSTKLILDNTELHVVVQLKAYKQEKVNGKNISELNSKLEVDNTIISKFVNTWKDIATYLKDYPPTRLSFNLLNEPEFQIPKPSTKKRDRWLSIAKKAALAIRSVSPDRTIILEGIGKSLFSSRNSKGNQKYKSPDDLLVPIGLQNIVYAFHNYEPEEFLQQAKYRYGSFGRKYKQKYSKIIITDAKKAISWANKHNVPIMLSETGCIGHIKDIEGPESNDDCGKFAADIQKNYIENGVGVSWWALEKEKTIYNRKWPNVWMPYDLTPNQSIFNGFKLKIQ